MTVKAWAASVLILTVGWGCDYTPDHPTPTSTPTPAPNGSMPVVVVPVPAQTPLPCRSSPAPTDGSSPLGRVRIVATTPEAGGTILVSRDASVRTRRPIIDFEFTYPQSLTLDNAHTNIQLLLVDRGVGCLMTDLGYATRLDRDDAVYVANSVARFRTGPWVSRVSPSRCGPGSSFSTQMVWYAVGSDPDREGYDGYVFMDWNFVVQ